MNAVGRVLLSGCCIAFLAAAPPSPEPREASSDGAASTPTAAKTETHRAPAAASTAADTSAAPVAAGGYVVRRDPVTGALGAPSASELQALVSQDSARRLVLPLREQPAGRGATLVRLNGRFRHYMTVQVGPDARLETGCAQHAEDAHGTH